jgi:hypothetical protein
MKNTRDIPRIQPEQITHIQTKTTPLPKTRFSTQELSKIKKKDHKNLKPSEEATQSTTHTHTHTHTQSTMQVPHTINRN